MTSASRFVREANLFVFYATYFWPLHRLFVKRRLSRRCNRCGISETAAPLESNGRCGLCNAPAVHTEVSSEALTQMRRELDELFSAAQGMGRGRYDVAVMFSGGKDSSFLVHHLKTTYPKLRILAITIDNSFLSPIALGNIESILYRLDVDHLLFRPRHAFCEAIVRHAILNRGQRGCSETVDLLDGDLLVDGGRYIASELRIPYVVIGFSYAQIERFYERPWYLSDEEKDHARRTHASVYEVEKLTPKEDLPYWWDGTAHAEESIPRLVYPHYAWRLGEEDIKRKVVEFGLVAKGMDNPLLTNSQLIPLENVLDVLTIGHSSWEPEFAAMVREGKASRYFWRNVFELVEYAAKTGRLLSGSLDEVLARLSLTRSDVGIAN